MIDRLQVGCTSKVHTLQPVFLFALPGRAHIAVRVAEV